MFSPVDTIWVLFGTALVFFMNAGFAMLETGFTRAKNAGNIIMKNIIDFAIGAVMYWIIGFGLMYGTDIMGLIGQPDFFLMNSSVYDGNVPGFATIMFQTVFAATAATIVSGAMAERTRFKSYILYSIIISAVVYPISGHWIWSSDGWLAQLGFVDFAGSTVVHMVGGISALIGAAVLGPRIGKYGPNGKPNAIPGHNITLGALGVFILWFGWFGFNGASTLGMEGSESVVSNVFMTTNLAAACGTIAAMSITWIRYKKPDVSMTLNGCLAGLVGITAGANVLDPWAAAIVGLLSGILVVFGIEFIDKVLKVDDPVGAVGVHGICGAFGTIMVGLFHREEGLFITGDASLLGVQTLGVLAVAAWVTVMMTIAFLIIKKTIGLRVTKEEEVLGLDSKEHGLPSAYADFMPITAVNIYDTPNLPAPSEISVPVEHVKASNTPASDVKMTKIDIITKQERFETLKQALYEIGITGMTVSSTLGCGMQRGSTEYYRGVPIEAKLLPKVKVEIVVCKVPVEEVIRVAKEALYTGKIGDGKIFVYDVENVIKIRTGESGYDALQDEE